MNTKKIKKMKVATKEKLIESIVYFFVVCFIFFISLTAGVIVCLLVNKFIYQFYNADFVLGWLSATGFMFLAGHKSEKWTKWILRLFGKEEVPTIHKQFSNDEEGVKRAKEYLIQQGLWVTDHGDDHTVSSANTFYKFFNGR